jgi:hypothetical protein
VSGSRIKSGMTRGKLFQEYLILSIANLAATKFNSKRIKPMFSTISWKN